MIKITSNHNNLNEVFVLFSFNIYILRFVAKRWLDQEEGDGKISVDLTDECKF
jgi:hypothetical protein